MGSESLTEALRETLAVFDGSGEPRTTPEVAAALDLGRRSTYARLKQLAERGRLETKKVGANARVWWRPTITEETTPSDSSAEDSERRRLPRRRKRPQSELEEVIARISDGFFAVDDEWRLTYLNDAITDLLETSPDQLRGEVLWEAFPDLRGTEFEGAYRAAMDTQEPDSVEAYYPPFDGWYRDIVYPSASGLSIYVLDVTDRVEYERELEQQRERFAALNSLNQVVNGVTDAVIGQSTRSEIETTACEYLADSESYSFAWIGDADPITQTMRLRTEAGVEGYLDDVTISVDPDDDLSEGPTGRAFRTGEMQTTQDILNDPAYEPWREAAREYGFRSSAAVPIVHERVVYGVLNVYAERPHAFEGREGTVIAQLGEIVGHAIAATERKRALLSDDLLALEFRIQDVFAAVEAATETDGTISFDRTIPIANDEFLVYGTATPDAVDSVPDLVEAFPHCDDAVVYPETNPPRFELQLCDPPVLSAVASLSGYVDSATIDGGEYRITVHLAPSVDVRRVVEVVETAYPQAELLSHRQITRTRDGPWHLEPRLEADLTDRQRVALAAAYHAGFFEWPRERSAEDVAGSLDIAPSTFHQHLRKGERKVFDALFSRWDDGTGLE